MRRRRRGSTRTRTGDGGEGRTRPAMCVLHTGTAYPPMGTAKQKCCPTKNRIEMGWEQQGTAEQHISQKIGNIRKNRIDKGPVLQGGKYAVPRGDAVPTAYLSGKTPDSISGDAVPTSGDAVPAARFGLNEQNGSPRAMTDEERAQMEAW